MEQSCLIFDGKIYERKSETIRQRDKRYESTIFFLERETMQILFQ